MNFKIKPLFACSQKPFNILKLILSCRSNVVFSANIEVQLRFVWSNSAAAQLLLHHRAGAVGAEMRRKGIYSIHAEHMAAALTSVSCANGEHKKVTEKS